MYCNADLCNVCYKLEICIKIANMSLDIMQITLWSTIIN